MALEFSDIPDPTRLIFPVMFETAPNVNNGRPELVFDCMKMDPMVSGRSFVPLMARLLTSPPGLVTVNPQIRAMFVKLTGLITGRNAEVEVIVVIVRFPVMFAPLEGRPEMWTDPNPYVFACKKIPAPTETNSVNSRDFNGQLEVEMSVTAPATAMPVEGDPARTTGPTAPALVLEETSMRATEPRLRIDSPLI